eukprot:NODE_277_length_10928_cov_0.583987.p7 type:complete len:229 gc:universal NODE_277_length_10928_cov_0.583987:9241-9927(+)
MAPVIVIAGYGPAISHEVCNAFSKKGYSLALIARTKSKLDQAVEQFKENGIKSAAFPTDLGDVKSVENTIKAIQKDLGSIAIIFWNGGGIGKPVLETSSEEYRFNFTANIDSLCVAINSAKSDLEKNKGAVLVTGGGLGVDHPMSTQMAINWKCGSFAINKAAQHKLVDLLHADLKPLGIYAGEVTVMSSVKGTPWDDGSATITAENVAKLFVELFEKRDKVFAKIDK